MESTNYENVTQLTFAPTRNKYEWNLNFMVLIFTTAIIPTS